MDKLYEGLLKLGVVNAEDKALKLREYVREIMLFNPLLKLVGEKSEDEIIARHILDSASAYSIFKRETNAGDSIADLGSGAGLPGVVLAILFPDREFILIERMNRRAGFLRGGLAKLALKNASVLECDIKDIDRRFSSLTCRAFHPIVDISKSAVSLLSDNGKAFFYKGQLKNAEAELEELSASYSFLSDIEGLDVPYLDAERVMVTLREWRKK